jgi:hypothetical protein
LDIKFLSNLQKTIKIKGTGAQFGAHLHKLNLCKERF